LVYRDGITSEHWTRARALSRRFANSWSDEYRSLKPASDLIGPLQEEISKWLDNPLRWTRPLEEEEEKTAAINAVRNMVFLALHELVTQRLADQHRGDWLTAYTHSGPGSGYRRSSEIRRIYEETAPPISSAMKPHGREFLTEVVGVVCEAVKKAGGGFEMAGAA